MTDDQTIPLADLDAHGLLDRYGAASPDIDSVQLSYVDARTILAVGYGGISKGRRVATGRVAWLTRARGGWTANPRRPRLGGGHSSAITDDDLAALVAWLKGGE